MPMTVKKRGAHAGGDPATVTMASSPGPDGSRCRSDSVDLAAHPGAVAPARLRSRLTLREWHLDDLIDSCTQTVSELVSNAIQATRDAGLNTGIRLTLTFDGDGLLVAVWDAVPAPPVPATPDEDSEHGRGLLIVSALAEWVDCRAVPMSHGGGKLVRAYIDLPQLSGK